MKARPFPASAGGERTVKEQPKAFPIMGRLFYVNTTQETECLPESIQTLDSQSVCCPDEA